MTYLNRKNFFGLIGGFFQANDKKIKKKRSSDVTLIQYLNAVIHMLTVSMTGGKRQVDATDYAYVLTLLASVTIATTFSAFFSLSVNLYVFQLVMHALNAANCPLFYMLLSMFVASTILSQAIEFLSKCMAIYVREALCASYRQFFEKSYTSSPKAINISENQSSFFTSIKVVSAHIPVIIKLSMIVLGYGVYAVMHFNPWLLLTSAVVGILVQYINRGALKRLENANTEARIIEQEIQSDRDQIYQNRKQLVGINAMGPQLKLMESNIKKLYSADVKLSLYKEFQSILAKLIEGLSHAVYYLYFSSAVFLGYMTLGEMFILLPFIEEIGKTAAKIVGLPLMTMTIRTSGSNLIQSWNELVEDDFKVDINYKPMKLSRSRIYSYTVIISILFIVLQELAYFTSLKSFSLVLSVIPMFVIIYPESTMAQLFGYLIKIAEYPYHQYRSPSFSGKVGEKTKKLESVSKISSGIANNQQHYSFDTNILTGKAVQIVGENGAGKTFITGLMGSKGIKGYYPCEKSLHLTAECVLLPVKGAYSKVLAESFDVNELTLAHYLKDNIEKWIPKIDATLKEVYPANVSTGIKQLIHVFSALHKAVLQKYEYVCIDEALYGVSSEKGISSEVYRVIIGICDSAGIQLAIVDNGMKVDDTLQVSAASAGENETVFKV